MVAVGGELLTEHIWSARAVAVPSRCSCERRDCSGDDSSFPDPREPCRQWEQLAENSCLYEWSVEGVGVEMP